MTDFGWVLKNWYHESNHRPSTRMSWVQLYVICSSSVKAMDPLPCGAKGSLSFTSLSQITYTSHTSYVRSLPPSHTHHVLPGCGSFQTTSLKAVISSNASQLSPAAVTTYWRRMRNCAQLTRACHPRGDSHHRRRGSLFCLFFNG